MDGIVSKNNNITYYPLPYRKEGSKVTNNLYREKYLALYGIELPKELSIVTKEELQVLMAQSREIKHKYANKVPFTTEVELSKEICWLASQTKYNLQVEVTVDNVRYDFVHIQPHKTKRKVVTIYEVKRDIVTYEDIRHKVLDRKYILKAKEYYKTEHVRLVFIAPSYTVDSLSWKQDYPIEVQTLKEFKEFLITKVRSPFPQDSKLLLNSEKELCGIT